jgi:hypothetical protein
MTNMPSEHDFKNFGIVMGTVCVPFFVLIGFLNTTAGMEFWRDKWHRILTWLTRKPRSGEPGSAVADTRKMSRTFSMEGMVPPTLEEGSNVLLTASRNGETRQKIVLEGVFDEIEC